MAERRPLERRHDAEREEAAEALGRAQAGEEARPAAPVVADQPDLRQLERVEQPEQVGRELLLVVAARRGASVHPWPRRSGITSR